MVSEGEHMPREEVKVKEERRTRRQRSCLRDVVARMEQRLAKVELATGDMLDRLQDVERNVEELQTGREDLRGELQIALNEALEMLTQRNEALEAQVEAIREEMG